MRSLTQTLRVVQRQFGTACVAHAPFKRLPSLAAINPVDINKYKQERTQADNLADAHEKSAENLEEDSHEDMGLIKSLLYGSSRIKKEAAELEHSFSAQLKRGRVVHEITFHNVMAHKSTEYLAAISSTYPKLSQKSQGNAELIGSWRTVIGDMDQYVHIWRYSGFPEFHAANVWAHKQDFYLDYLNQLRGSLRSRQSQIVSEFDFWGTTPKPRNWGGIFELRTYDLKPGTMADWEHHWRQGLDCRKQVMEPVGAWFTSMGPLHRVYHIWQFLDLEHRRISRQKSWEVPGWAETTHETVKLINHMESQILVPLEFSPLQ